MNLNIQRQVAKLSPKTDVFTVLSEAITNSVHAGANEIKVSFSTEETIFSAKDGSERDAKGLIIKSIQVEDNGIGFTDENIKSFCEYGSDFKADIGCKGIGRLTYLKIFEKVIIESRLPNYAVNFEFSKNFKPEDIDKRFEKSTEPKTVVAFEVLRKNYKEKSINLNELVSSLRLNLTPLLFLQRKTRQVSITFEDSRLGLISTISTSEIPEFKLLNFTIQEHLTNDKKLVPFNLYYSIEKKMGVQNLDAYHVAHKLTVMKFSKVGLPISVRPNANITFLLTSPYLDDRVNDSRDHFKIYPQQEDFISPISWNKINSKLSEEISLILKSYFKELEQEHEELVERVNKEHLHLADYIHLDPLTDASGIDRAVKQANDAYIKDKTKFIKDLDEGKISIDKAIKKASQFSGRELIEYVQMRDRIITQLERLADDKEEREKVIHDMILPQGLEGGMIDPLENHLWLIDDRFMGFSYAASDKQIRKVMKAVTGKDNLEKSQKEPDFSVFFRNEKDNHNAVIVELKPFDDNPKKKYNGIYQLRQYAREFREEESLDQIWYYLITDIDKKFERELLDDEFKPLFSTEDKILFRYYEPINTYIYVISSQSIISDARARNKTFIDMIKQNISMKKKPIVE